MNLIFYFQNLQRESPKTTGQRHKSKENELDVCMLLTEAASTNFFTKRHKGFWWYGNHIIKRKRKSVKFNDLQKSRSTVGKMKLGLMKYKHLRLIVI